MEFKEQGEVVGRVYVSTEFQFHKVTLAAL